MRAGAFALFALCGAQARAEVLEVHPALWHVKSLHGEVILFGSMHVLPADMNWLTPEVVNDLKRADAFVFEAPTDEASQKALDDLVAARASLPAGQSLRALLPPQSQNDYDNVLAATHLKLAIVDHEQPWLASMQLGLADSISRRYFPDACVDYVLMHWVNTRGRNVRYLETIGEQFAMIEPGDGGLRLDDLESRLHNFGEGKSYLPPLIDAWSRGDAVRFGEEIDAIFAGHPEAKEKLLTARNRKWAAQIERMAQEGQRIFVTVGASHLVGPTGVPALLRADGFAVEGP